MGVIPILIALTLAVAPLSASAQGGAEWNPEGLKMGRAELESLLQDLEGVASSSGYSGRVRERAERDAGVIRDRLEQGDFRVGDRIVLRVEGESGLPESFPVEPGPAITLPVMGAISLRGVLRSELEDHLIRELGRFIQNPVVRADSEVRVAVLGSVGRPGFYTVPADMLVEEVLMHAGGPGANADLDNLRIERMGDPIWTGSEMRQFIVDGATLDQLNVRAGDQIMLPARSGASFWGRAARWGAAIATSVLFGVRIFF